MAENIVFESGLLLQLCECALSTFANAIACGKYVGIELGMEIVERLHETDAHATQVMTAIFCQPIHHFEV